MVQSTNHVITTLTMFYYYPLINVHSFVAALIMSTKWHRYRTSLFWCNVAECLDEQQSNVFMCFTDTPWGPRYRWFPYLACNSCSSFGDQASGHPTKSSWPYSPAHRSVILYCMRSHSHIPLTQSVHNTVMPPVAIVIKAIRCTCLRALYHD